MVLNPDKCHFMTLGFQNQNFNFSYKNVVTKNSAEQNLKKYNICCLLIVSILHLESF